MKLIGKNIKKTAGVLLLAALILLSLSSCAPEFSEVENTFKALIESSAEINEILFGEGLPHTEPEVSVTDGEYSDVYGEELYYAYVLDESKYHTIDEIKKAAEAVYTAGYLGGIYPIIFEGYYDDATYNVIRARYIEKEEVLMFYTASEIHDVGREYHYDTMKIVKPSSRNYVTVEIEAYGMYLDRETLEYKEGNSTVRLGFVREGGEWKLDTPTY